MTHFTLADVQHTYKSRDAWWTVFLVDPLAGRLVVWTANRTAVTPNQLTTGAGILGLIAAVCFAMATWPWLVVGALMFHLSFVLDCMDGKLARLKDNGSVFGVWVDFILDRVRFFVCMMALLVGQWLLTGEVVYLLLAPIVVFLGMLRYLNGAQTAKTRSALRRRLDGDDRTGPAAESHADTEEDPEGESGFENQAPPAADAPAPRGLYPRIRALLLRHRVRPHLFSGIEFEMFICVLAPLTALLSLVAPMRTLIVPVVVFAAAALVAFEAIIVYRLWRLARGR